MAGTIVADNVVDSLGNPFLQSDGESFTTNGYQKLSNGLIIQWGYFTAASATFPITFPNTAFQVSLTPTRSTATSSWDTTFWLSRIAPTSITRSGFEVMAYTSTIGSYSYIAIGN